MTTRAIAERSNFQNNAINNTRRGYFLYFRTIRANPFEGFRAFGNNNNNNPLLPLLLPPGFRGGLKGGFNSLSRRNAGGLDLNVVALVNVLTGANLGINHTERESNHVKLTEFGETEVEDPNEWLEYYNRIAEANK